MSDTNNRKYMLAVKRGNNNYLPLEWQLCKSYDNENLSTLEGIDHLTSLLYPDELAMEAVNAKLMTEYEHIEGFSIIYEEKDKVRELKEGVIYYDEEFCLGFYLVKEFIEKNISNKALINNIANILGSFREPSDDLIKFIFVLRNLSVFEKKGPNGITAALSMFDNVPYDEKRKASLLIHRKFGPIYVREVDYSLVMDNAS